MTLHSNTHLFDGKIINENISGIIYRLMDIIAPLIVSHWMILSEEFI